MSPVLVQRTQIFVEWELIDKRKVQRTVISFRLRCAAPLITSMAFFLQILSRRCRFQLLSYCSVVSKF
jgi:hypothetical protein